MNKRAIERKKNVCIYIFYNISSYWTKYHCGRWRQRHKNKGKERKTFSEMFNNKFSVLQYFPFLSHEHNVIESIAIEKTKRKKSYYKLFFHLLMELWGIFISFRSFFIALTRCQKPRWFLRALLCFIISTLCWMKAKKKKMNDWNEWVMHGMSQWNECLLLIYLL